jgi:toxin ParE1/3/4
VGRVDRTAKSVQDEFDIALYIARDNPPAGRQLLKLIDNQLQLLAEFPGMGQARDDLLPGLRSYPIKRTYLLMYRPVEGGIELVRVLHGMRNLDEEFRG